MINGLDVQFFQAYIICIEYCWMVCLGRVFLSEYFYHVFVICNYTASMDDIKWINNIRGGSWRRYERYDRKYLVGDAADKWKIQEIWKGM